MPLFDHLSVDAWPGRTRFAVQDGGVERVVFVSRRDVRRLRDYLDRYLKRTAKKPPKK